MKIKIRPKAQLPKEKRFIKFRYLRLHIGQRVKCRVGGKIYTIYQLGKLPGWFQVKGGKGWNNVDYFLIPKRKNHDLERIKETATFLLKK